jgi:hypothetical protein
MADLSRMAITFPSEMVLEVTEVMLELQQNIQSQDKVAVLHLVRNATITPQAGRRVEDVEQELISGSAEVVDSTEGVTAARGRGARKQAAPAKAAGGGPASNSAGPQAQKKYRVIDPKIVVGRVPHEVRMTLLQKGPMTAKELEEATKRGKKSIESALWGLRNAGSVESVENTGVIKQAKFNKKDIAAGAPKE